MIRLLAALACGVALLAKPALAAEAPRFISETKASGIDHIYSGEEMLFMTGGGVAAFDCSGDGLPELFFAGGAGTSRLYRNQSRKGGALKFEEDWNSGLTLERVTGAYPLDVDGDGHVDLVLLRIGENILYRGLGECTFKRANEDWNFDGGNAWTTAFSATWEAGNSWPTLAVGNFLERGSITMGYGDCDENRIYRPNENGDGFASPLALKPGHCALSMLFSDWNRDGISDLRVSNDMEFYRFGEEQLFRFTPAGPKSYGREEDWQQIKIWGMGIAAHDVTGDGYPEYYLTNITDNRFEVLVDGASRPLYQDMAKAFNVVAGEPFAGGDLRPSTGWHAEFGDVNNDGLADLLVVKGKVEGGNFAADADPNNLLIGQADGTFKEGAKDAGVLSYRTGRGGSLVDLNNDGWLDLVVNNRLESAEVWRNAGEGTGNWLRLKLKMAGGNRMGVGCWVEVRTAAGVQRREITVGGGHAGGQWGWLHFGLGNAETAEVRVQWPDGKWGPWMKVSANRFAEIEQVTTGPRPRNRLIYKSSF